ncbi:MAG: septum formation initiator family protein [Bacteroidales bacterium]|nr:septum formation initiator family protein [Bacteroidales bacterium]
MDFKNSTIWRIVKNKYVIAFLVFLAVFFFFDENNFFVTRSLRRDVGNLKHTLDTLHQGIINDSIQAERLKDNMDSIERYGREKYYMKRNNEDVFVINDAG